MKFKLAAIALFCSAAMMCSESNADLLGRMLGRGGCGGCQTASSCCDTPAQACCGRTLSININIGLPGRLFRGCGGGGLLSRGCDTGCAPAVAPVVDDCCGCGGRLFDGSLLGRLRGRLSSIGGCGCETDCGCAPAPAEPCGPTCNDGCGGMFSGGLLGRLRGGCGCEAPAPAMDCGCNDGCDACGGRLRSRVSGLLSRVRPNFGCNTCEAPANDCGCEDACSRGGRLRSIVGGVTGRVRGMFCNRCGHEAHDCCCHERHFHPIARVRGMFNRGCNDDCCPNSGCGCGTMEAEMNPTPAAEGAEVAPQADGAYIQPIVDPQAFVIRRN